MVMRVLWGVGAVLALAGTPVSAEEALDEQAVNEELERLEERLLEDLEELQELRTLRALLAAEAEGVGGAGEFGIEEEEERWEVEPDFDLFQSDEDDIFGTTGE